MSFKSVSEKIQSYKETTKKKILNDLYAELAASKLNDQKKIQALIKLNDQTYQKVKDKLTEIVDQKVEEYFSKINLDLNELIDSFNSRIEDLTLNISEATVEADIKNMVAPEIVSDPIKAEVVKNETVSVQGSVDPEQRSGAEVSFENEPENKEGNISAQDFATQGDSAENTGEIAQGEAADPDNFRGVEDASANSENSETPEKQPNTETQDLGNNALEGEKDPAAPGGTASEGEGENKDDDLKDENDSGETGDSAAREKDQGSDPEAEQKDQGSEQKEEISNPKPGVIYFS